MKYVFALLLALFALVAVSGFAAADRLPHEVPENQIFSIDTLIDVTGTVTDSTEMQWTIDSQELAYTEAIKNPNGGGLIISQAQYDIIKDALKGIPFDFEFHDSYDYEVHGIVVTQMKVPDEYLNKLVNQAKWPGMTWGDLMNEMEDLGDTYTIQTGKDQGEIHNSVLNPTEEIAIVTYKDSIRTNGGKLSENKNVAFDSQNKGKGLSNLEATKVVTYASTEGAHLIGSEEWNLDVAGNYENTADTIRCVFASAKSTIWPAFCNAVKAKSELVNINSAQISTKGNIRAVAASGDVPAELNYQIAVTPDSNSGSGFAEGTVKTQFGGAIMEARGKNNVPSATNNWNDKTEVTGGIKNFQKTFAYQSGFRF